MERKIYKDTKIIGEKQVRATFRILFGKEKGKAYLWIRLKTIGNTIMETNKSTVFNQAQIDLLDIMSFVQSPEALKQLKRSSF